MDTSARAFKNHLQRLSNWGRKHNIQHAYNGGHGCFETLSDSEKALAITGLQKYGDFLSAFEELDLDLGNSHQLTTAALKMLQLQAPKGFTDQILPTDFVEIYLGDLVPAFRSPNFWGTSSYLLDEIYSYRYDELFERPEFFQAAINRAAQTVFSGKMAVLENPIPEHVAWEKRGPRKCQIKYRYLASVYDDDGDIAGALVICDIKPLDPSQPGPVPEPGSH